MIPEMVSVVNREARPKRWIVAIAASRIKRDLIMSLKKCSSVWGTPALLAAEVMTLVRNMPVSKIVPAATTT